jgi:hypothetical protein
MNISIPVECKYLEPEDCEMFKPYCTKTKKGKCQRSRDGLDLPRDEVLSYLEEKRKRGTKIEQTHIKRGGIKISGVMTDVNVFNSILTVTQTGSNTIINESIVVKFFLEDNEILDLRGYIKKMTEENLAIDEKMRDYSGNSRYNSINSTQTECNVLQINWIGTNENYTGNRFAMYAMYLVEQYAKQYYGIKYITLEDHASVGPPNNIYYKLNFNLLASDRNSAGPYDIWKDWHKWTAEKGMDEVPGDERMISVEQFEANSEIRLVQEKFEIQK